MHFIHVYFSAVIMLIYRSNINGSVKYICVCDFIVYFKMPLFDTVNLAFINCSMVFAHHGPNSVLSTLLLTDT